MCVSTVASVRARMSRFSAVRAVAFTAAFSVIVLSFSAISSAAVYTGGAGGAIPDAPADNVPGTPLSTSIVVADSFPVGTVSVELTDLFHAYVGDIIATLQSPSGDTMELFHRMGLPEVNPTYGDSSVFGGTYTLSDAGTITLAAAALAVGEDETVPSGTYRTSDSSDVPTVLSLPFLGDNSAGTWTLSMTDNGHLDTGVLGGWALELTAIPEPGALGLMAGATMALLAARRRRVR